ncbi:MAG TPA: nucleotide exchange factor GrpE [Chlamydiales bacterium]|nr:nucleotide exchange factor GrpE [Chlamydiales bacterium]
MTKETPDNKEDKAKQKDESKQETNLKNETTIEDIQKEQEAIDYKNKYLRLLADSENSRKRMQKDKEDTLQFAVENTISEFLPAIDTLENALKYAKNSSPEVQQWATGFQMILTQFQDVLHTHGIVAFHSEGNLFDPHFHEAMEIIETQDHPDGTILEELAKGYKTKNRTIRPARVKVAKKPFKAPEEEPTENKDSKNNKNMEK